MVEGSPERRLLELAIERGVPVLGVCGGMQLLNVVRGGTLHQHLPADRAGSLDHEQKTPRDQAAHAIAVEAGSFLARAKGSVEAFVNSTHHQAVKELGAGLVPTAFAPDGVIEACEDPAARFVVGVQWHPELMLATETWSTGTFQLTSATSVAAARGAVPGGGTSRRRPSLRRVSVRAYRPRVPSGRVQMES